MYETAGYRRHLVCNNIQRAFNEKLAEWTGRYIQCGPQQELTQQESYRTLQCNITFIKFN